MSPLGQHREDLFDIVAIRSGQVKASHSNRLGFTSRLTASRLYARLHGQKLQIQIPGKCSLAQGLATQLSRP